MTALALFASRPTSRWAVSRSLRTVVAKAAQRRASGGPVQDYCNAGLKWGFMVASVAVRSSGRQPGLDADSDDSGSCVWLVKR